MKANDKLDARMERIAALLRMVDVLEGRQPLGKPDGAKKGAGR